MTYWAALGQAGGTVLNYEAAGQRRNQLNDLNKGRRSGQRQLDQWAMEDENDLIGDLNGLKDRRYESQLTLANDLSGPARAAAGDEARTRAHADIAAALSLADRRPTANRAALTGNTGGFDKWQANTSAQTQPLLDAREKLLTESRAQGGLARFDRGALDRNANTSIDISRQAQERQQLSQLLALQRQKMLAQLGIQYADPGPTQSQQNLGTFAGLMGAAGGVADSYSAGSSNQGGPGTGENYDWFRDTGGTQDGYTYNPYSQFNTGG